MVTQHTEYLPFGELLVDEHQNSYNTPYKFNGKELDAETGNYYMTARYYNPKWSIWLSVDPLAEQMPSFSSYNYTFSNPIKLTDPTGMAPEMPDDIIIKGNKTYRKQVLADLQQLTDNKLAIDKNGKVYEVACQGRSCSEGTNLISDLVNSEKIITVLQSKTTNSTQVLNLNALHPLFRVYLYTFY